MAAPAARAAEPCAAEGREARDVGGPRPAGTGPAGPATGAAGQQPARRTAGLVPGLLVAALVALLLAVLSGQLSVARVETASMAPAVAPGSLVVGRPVQPGQLEPGDLLTARVPSLGASVTHRVVGLTVDDGRTLVRTRGDANPDVDPWTTTLPQEQASRVVATVPWLGALLGRGPAGVPPLAVPLLVAMGCWTGCVRLLRLLREAA